MSDPVTNVEIEDVLSSIRRLVAEGGKSSAPTDAQENMDATDNTAAERFVLTPALRVAEPVVDDADEAFSPESEELAAQFVAPAPEPLILRPSPVVDEPMVHDEMSAAERESLEATIAELEAAVSDQAHEWEPDGSEAAPMAAPAALTAMFTRDDAEEDGELVEHDDIEEVEDDVVYEDDTAPEAEVVALRMPPEAELPEEPTFRHSVSDDASDTDFGDELAADSDDDGIPIPDDLDENIAAYLAGGSSIDQDVLREMISEVVREELQGEMGERITRNIRKLVRREINNALSSKSF